MKILILVVFLVIAPIATVAKGRSSSSSGGTVHVSGHTTKKGTQVPEHERTRADSTKNNNWSTKGNTNPNTGKKGTKKPD